MQAINIRVPLKSDNKEEPNASNVRFPLELDSSKEAKATLKSNAKEEPKESSTDLTNNVLLYDTNKAEAGSTEKKLAKVGSNVITVISHLESVVTTSMVADLVDTFPETSTEQFAYLKNDTCR
jgi:hypothetical protein